MKDIGPNRRQVLRGLAITGGFALFGRFALAEDLEIKLGKPTVFPFHPQEKRELIKSTLACAPHHNNVLMYDEYGCNGRKIFLNIQRNSENIKDLETLILDKEDFKQFFEQGECVPGGFVWQHHEKKPVGYLIYRGPVDNKSTVFHVEFTDFKNKPKIKPVYSVVANTNFFYPEVSSLDDLALWNENNRSITLVSKKGAITNVPLNKNYFVLSKAVWNHPTKRSSQMIAYVAEEKITERRGIIFYKPQTRKFKFQPINLGARDFELIHNIAWDHNNDIYLETDSAIFSHQEGEIKMLDQGKFQVHQSPLIIHPKFTGVFYFKREETTDKHGGKKASYSICNANPTKTRVLAKPHYVNGLSIDHQGKFLYCIEGDQQQKYFLTSREIKKS
ncbi:MAG: hypothetical protein KAT77_00885 [Nanoarchaeota archaeon]|nr:hypothetical protein [Nanoarchaeota archaeon]